MDNQTTVKKRKTFEHRGRLEQIPIYLGKQVRMFIFQNGWVTLPLSVLIAAMVAMVIRSSCGLDMEGTLKGAFALSCASIWNGCFNSIQVVCRERAIVKREHRSGMYVFSYVSAHVIYQGILCLLQTLFTMIVLYFGGVYLEGAGIVTGSMFLDIGLSIFFITFAADMLSLMVSCFVRTTTAAMTVMPFVLIFQMVFSGGIFTNLPGWSKPLANLTLSKYGLNVIAAQCHYNELPMERGWSMIARLKKEVLIGPMTLREVLEGVDYGKLDLHLSKKQKKQLLTEEQLNQLIEEGQLDQFLTEEQLDQLRTEGQPEKFLTEEQLNQLLEEEQLNQLFTEEQLDQQVVEAITVGDVLEAYGEKEAREVVEKKVAETSQRSAFASTKENVFSCWFALIGSAAAYLAAALIALAFIDKDKR